MTEKKPDYYRILTLAKFRVKIKSLAEEARIIRKEEKRAHGLDYVPGSLRQHRVWNVRNEQRATLLAYAFYRGKPYSLVEQKASKEFPTKRVEEILWSIAGVPKPDIKTWCQKQTA